MKLPFLSNDKEKIKLIEENARLKAREEFRNEIESLKNEVDKYKNLSSNTTDSKKEIIELQHLLQQSKENAKEKEIGYNQLLNEQQQQIENLKNQITALSNQHSLTDSDLINNYIDEINQLREENAKFQSKIQELEQQPTETETNPFDEHIDNLNKVIIQQNNYNNYSEEILNLIYTVLSKDKDDDGSSLVKLTIKIFEKMGFDAKNNDGYNDNQKDVIVYHKNTQNIFAVIQCKSHSPQKNNKRIESNAVGNFNGYTSEYANKLFITSSFFTGKAISDLSNKCLLFDRLSLITLLSIYFPTETANVINNFTFYNDVNQGKGNNYDKNYFPNCPNCKHGKLQKLWTDKKRYMYQCMTCNHSYYSNGDATFNKLDKFSKFSYLQK